MIVKIEHELLDSKNATFCALFNELLKWAESNGLTRQQVQHFLDGFRR